MLDLSPTLAAWLTSPFVHGALVGWATAAGVDLLTLKKANSWGDFFSQFDFRVASFMWAKGIIFGALAEGGLNVTFGI